MHVSAEMCTKSLQISFSDTLREELPSVLLTVLTCNSRSQDLKIEIYMLKRFSCNLIEMTRDYFLKLLERKIRHFVIIIS